MTTEKQKQAVKFSEYWTGNKFTGDINSPIDVSTYLSNNLKEAKKKAYETSVERRIRKIEREVQESIYYEEY